MNAAWDVLAEGKPILVAGENYTVLHAGPAGKGKELVASQFYIQALHRNTSCGGAIGLVCPEGQTCDIPQENACGGAQLPGVCEVIPSACTNFGNPVCGCDGLTYLNACQRLAAQVQQAHVGECP